MFLPVNHRSCPGRGSSEGCGSDRLLLWTQPVHRPAGPRRRSLKTPSSASSSRAALWLLIPCHLMPGLMAFSSSRASWPVRTRHTHLIREIIPPASAASSGGARGSGHQHSGIGLEAASTSSRWRLRQHLNRRADDRHLVTVGRIATIVAVTLALGVALSPLPRGGVFRFIQEFQGYISPDRAAFVFGFVVRRPRRRGCRRTPLERPVYGRFSGPGRSCPTSIGCSRRLRHRGHHGDHHAPLATATPRVLPVRQDVDLRPSPVVWIVGGL